MKSEKLKFFVGFLSGFIFFLFPIKFGGKITVPFDVAIKSFKKSFPYGSQLFTLSLITLGTLLSIYVSFKGKNSSGALKYLKTNKFGLLLRFLGVILSFGFFFGFLPDTIFSSEVKKTIWNILAVSVALIIPVGAVFINYFTKYGGVEFVGTLSEPLMRPLFKLPGRSALDAITSWIGSYSVALYLTRNIFEDGGYSKRDVFVIATSFSTVSIGFVGVVAETLNILNYFPLIFAGYFFVTIVTAMIMVRIPPTTKIPVEYISKNKAYKPKRSTVSEALKLAYSKAKRSPSFFNIGIKGFIDGLFLGASILPTIVLIGTIALLLAYKTKFLDYLGLPFYPIYKILGANNPILLSKATISGLFEMYLPALLSIKLSLKLKIFIALLSTTQIIFFSSIGPMIMEMFKDIPIKFSHLLIIFLERTLIIIPIAWFLSSLLTINS